MGRARGQLRGADKSFRRATRRLTGPTTWTDERLEAALREFVGDAVEWPSRTRFMAADRQGLYEAMRDHGGHLYWAHRLGLRLSSAQQPRSVPLDELVDQARTVIAQEGRLPNQERLRLLGYPRLATAVQRAGGAQKFKAQHDL